MAESLADLHRQKEDIEILLSTLEEAYRDASITEEHYNEVKTKNQKKLEEIKDKIEKLEKAAARSAEEETVEKKPAETGKKRKSKKTGKGRKARAAKTETQSPPQTESPVAASAPLPAEQAAASAATASPPEEPSTDYSGIPQPLTDIAGEDEPVSVSPDKAPGAVRTAEPGTLSYTAQEVKEMLNKVLKEIRPQGLEVAPRVDKLEVQLEKLRAYIEAMKDERSAAKENIQRINEEMGEIRSTVSTLDRKVSESEMKVAEIDQALGDLRPARFIKALHEQDKTIKIHDARLDKLDDLSSIMLKKLGQIEEVLKRLGSLEKIVNFSREAAKRLLEIENREKRINRIADKIDGIFMELNKRLDEFVLYKAKQDTLDELSQEMMKSLDEITTKLQNYAEKSDLDMLKDMFQTEIASLRTSMGTNPEVQKLEAQKTEIEGLIAMLEEQFKAGALPEKEYKKTKQINMERLRDIEKKISAIQSGAAETGGAPEGQPAPAEEPVKEPNPSIQSVPKPRAQAHPEKEGSKPSPGNQAAAPDAKKAVQDRQEELMSELENSLMRGLISRDAFEKAKELIKGRREDKK